MIDDLEGSDLEQAGFEKPRPTLNSSSIKKERLEDIINAVSEKEDVITAFRGTKKNSRDKLNADYLPSENLQKMSAYFARPWKFLFLQFCGGICFALGLILVLGVAFHFFIHTKDVRIVGSMFHKFVVLLKSLGR